MSLNIFTGNRLEALLEQLGTVVDRPLSSPLEQEVIVVQSKGMQRWLTMEFAKKHGVWANCIYPFPNNLLDDLFRATGLKSNESDLFKSEIMIWRVMRLCETLLDKSEFSELKGYLQGANSRLKSFQLAGKIADTFDQYTLFRADMLKDWESGGGTGWQPILWREILKETGNGHRGTLQEKLLTKLVRGDIDRSHLPTRLSVFGISSLPQFHLNVLAALSILTEVNIFVLSPCREYWADLVSPKAAARRSREEREQIDNGQPLLASLGYLGRDFSHMILDIEDLHGGERDLYSSIAGDTLLADLQNGILDLRENDGTKKTILKSDKSIQMHSCHSPMREVEVLHDQLIYMLGELEGLTPKDILVMTPDIETYAPYITAVFDGIQERSRRIPFSIADRSLKGEGEVAKTFMSILAMSSGRFTAPEVMDVLSSPPVSRKFGLSDDEMETARLMIQQTRVCWGMDEKDREKLGLPAYRDHSWKSGFDRLLLGYALPEEDLATFDGIFPCDNVEGSRSLVLGKLVTFVENLHTTVNSLNGVKSLSGWAAALNDILNSYFETEDSAQREVESIKDIVIGLADQEKLASFSEEVGLDIVNSWLKGKLEKTSRGFGYMNGGVTFCAMLPMRSVPFRVVVLLGMNDEKFPRQDRPPGFDLISQGKRRIGDRSLREEDRYLFLEALLSARDILYISYIGQSLKDNSIVPPSVLVSELMDYLNKSYIIGDEKPEKGLVTKHRLQPFNTEYFEKDSGLFSYSSENLAAAQGRQSFSSDDAMFITESLSEPPDELRNVTVAGLARFFANPSEYFVKTRLGIFHRKNNQAIEDREPFDLDGLDSYCMVQEMVSLELSGGDCSDLLPVARSRGQLPPGRKGDQEFERLVLEGKALVDRVKAEFDEADKLAPVDVDLRVGEFTIKGRIDNIWTTQLIHYRNVKLGGKDKVKLLIEHLILNTVKPEGYPLESVLVANDDSFRLAPIEESAQYLERLLSLYWNGLLSPLKFFPRSSLEYAETGDLSKARKKWDGRYPEKDDPYFDICFGKTDPFDDEFIDAALTVFDGFSE